jgi:hypothetical protein
VPVDEQDFGVWEQILPEREKEARARVLEPPEPMLGVAALHELSHLLPAALVHHGNERLVDEPGHVVVGEYLVVEGDDLFVLEVAVRVRWQRLQQLVAQKQPSPVQQLRGRRGPAPMKTRDD